MGIPEHEGEESGSEVFDASISPEPGSYFMFSAKVFLSPPAMVSLVGGYDGMRYSSWGPMLLPHTVCCRPKGQYVHWRSRALYPP